MIFDGEMLSGLIQFIIWLSIGFYADGVIKENLSYEDKVRNKVIVEGKTVYSIKGGEHLTCKQITSTDCGYQLSECNDGSVRYCVNGEKVLTVTEKK